MWAEKNKHLREFVWSFQFNSPWVWHAGARGAREREGTASVFTLIPSDSSLDSLGIDCHAFLPSMDNQSLFFWGALNGHKSSGLSFHIGKWKASDLWAFTLHVTHLMTKLHLTSAFGKTYQNSPACSIGVGKLKERKKKSSFAYSVNSLICFLSWHFKPSSVSACKLIFGSGSSLKSYNEHMSVCQTSKHACASVGIQKEQSSRPWK